MVVTELLRSSLALPNDIVKTIWHADIKDGIFGGSFLFPSGVFLHSSLGISIDKSLMFVSRVRILFQKYYFNWIIFTYIYKYLVQEIEKTGKDGGHTPPFRAEANKKWIARNILNFRRVQNNQALSSNFSHPYSYAFANQKYFGSLSLIQIKPFFYY